MSGDGGGTPSIAPAVARRIRLLVLDADGVLTDGGLFVGTRGGERFELRRFHVQDGLAVHLLRAAGVVVAIVSGKDSEAVRIRAEELGIHEVHQVGAFEKLPVVAELLERLELEWDETAFLSDDLADLAVLERVGLPAAVANAAAEVRAAARWQGRVPGGSGAVREFAEALLHARGEWEGLVRAYLADCRRRVEDGGA